MSNGMTLSLGHPFPLFSRRKSLAEKHGLSLSPQISALIVDVIDWALAQQAQAAPESSHEITIDDVFRLCSKYKLNGAADDQVDFIRELLAIARPIESAPEQEAPPAPNCAALIAHWLKLGDQSERDGFHAEADAYRVCADQLRQEIAALQPAHTHQCHPPTTTERTRMNATAEAEAPQTLAATKPTSAPPRIGHAWPAQGGIYLGQIPSGDADGDWHIILATDPAGDLQDQAWGTYGVSVPGATSYSDGPANTRAMAEAGSDLAKAMLALQIEGHADWYLMSADEARLTFIAARDHMPKEWHWTSTQFSANHAWSQFFDDGSQFITDKDYQGRARAVRRFKLSA